MRIQTILAGLGVCLTIAGCNEFGVKADEKLAGEGLKVSLQREIYAAGDTVVFEMRNLSDAAIPYSLCPLALEQEQSPRQWALSPHQADPSQIMCSLALYVLDPGRSVTGLFVLQQEVTAGKYRVLIRPGFADPSGQGEVPPVVTPTFEVTQGE